MQASVMRLSPDQEVSDKLGEKFRKCDNFTHFIRGELLVIVPFFSGFVAKETEIEFHNGDSGKLWRCACACKKILFRHGQSELVQTSPAANLRTRFQL